VKTDHCPICNVAVKPENLVRHLNDIHPRHPDTAGLVEKLKQEGGAFVPKRSAAPIRIRRWQVAVAFGIAAAIVGGILIAPYFDPYRNFGPDSCIDEIRVPVGVPYHMHPLLAIVAQGNVQPIPGQIGITSTCTHPIHTHSASDASGVVQMHVETPIAHPFYLRDFFYVWGQPFDANRILGFTDDGTNHVSMTVNGTASTAYGNLVLWDAQRIIITYGP